MTDFLDQLEADLREAADRRGAPRRRRPTGALKAIAVFAAVALLVVGVARLANPTDTDRPASTPTPAPADPRTHGVGIATAGDPGLLDVVAAPLESKLAIDRTPVEGSRTADPSLGSVVLYRPGHEETAGFAARVAKIDRVEPLTEASERKIRFDVRDRNVVVVYGTDAEERVLNDPKTCKTAGRPLSLCTAMADQASRSAFLVDGHAIPVEPPKGIGRWRWAAASPDGETILAQWSAECEVPQAYLIDAAGGTPRPLGTTSEALGWTTTGQAIVFLLPDRGCGGAKEAGIYLADLDGTLTLQRRTDEIPPELEPSLLPRSPADIR